MDLEQAAKIIGIIGQTVAIIAACWAIYSGIDAWKKEYLGKRKIEIAEELLAGFFEVRDAIAYIRNPFSSVGEGAARKRKEGESAGESKVLDQAYVAIERYQRKEQAFSKFWSIKYRCMAYFGSEIEEAFSETNRIVNSIFISASALGTTYWRSSERAGLDDDQRREFLDQMHRHERIFWDFQESDDPIRDRLKNVLGKLEEITAPCFKIKAS